MKNNTAYKNKANSGAIKHIYSKELYIDMTKLLSGHILERQGMQHSCSINDKGLNLVNSGQFKDETQQNSKQI